MKKFYLLTILCALLGISQAWADEACTLVTSNGAKITTNEKNTLICVVGPFENTDGVDSIQFKYTCEKKITVYYSTDGGNNYTKLDDKGGGYTDRQVSNSLAGHETVNCFKFETAEKGNYSGWFSYNDYDCTVYDIKVFRSPSISLDNTSYKFHETAVGRELSQSFNITTYSLTNDLSIVKSGANADCFSYELSEASGSCPTTYTLTVTYAPLAETTGEDMHVASFAISANGKTATLNVSGTASSLVAPTYTWKGVGNYYVGGEALDLNTLWTSSSPADKYYTIKSWTAEAGIPIEGATAPAINDGVLSLGQAGTLVLKVAQEATTGYTEGSKEQTIVINRNVTKFVWASEPYFFNTVFDVVSTNNDDVEFVSESTETLVASIDKTTLTIYNIEGSTTINVSQVENYKWTGLNDSKVVTPVYPNNLVGFTISELNYLTYEVETSTNNIEWETPGYKMSDGNTSKKEGFVVIGFSGMPDSLEFTKKCDKYAGMFYPSDGDCLFEVFESATNGDWGESIWSKNNESGETPTIKLSLQPTTRFVKLRYFGTIYGHYNDIKITERKQFEAEDVAFGDVEINSDPVEKPLVFKHANAGYNVSVVLNEESETKHFAIDHTTVANSGGEKWGEEPFVITYTPSEVGEHTATVTFSDLLGNKKVVTLTGKTIKIKPTIDTEPTASNITYGQKLSASVLADGVAKHGETTLEGGFAWVDGEEELNAGDYSKEVIFTPSNTAIYETVIFEVDVTVEKATPVITTAPQAADIKIGQTLADSYLDNGEASVEGTFAWQDNTIKPDSTGNKKYNVIFTPNDTENYNTVIIEVEVRVTDQETAVFNTESGLKATKILRDGQVLILRDGKVYNLNGLEVR